jgi:hypothetical protein
MRDSKRATTHKSQLTNAATAGAFPFAESRRGVADHVRSRTCRASNRLGVSTSPLPGPHRRGLRSRAVHVFFERFDKARVGVPAFILPIDFVHHLRSLLGIDGQQDGIDFRFHAVVTFLRLR